MSRPVVDLRALRLNRGLGPDAAAEKIGIPTSVLLRAESGETRPQASNAYKIATFYELKVTDIWPVGEETVAA